MMIWVVYVICQSLSYWSVMNVMMPGVFFGHVCQLFVCLLTFWFDLESVLVDLAGLLDLQI